MKVDGRCHCGAITYEAENEPARVGISHSSDCQALTASAFRVSVPAPAEMFVLRGAKPTVYIKTADSGAKRAHAFCPTCGAPVYSAAPESPTTYLLRVGALRQRAELRPHRQIWCRSALPWSMNLEHVEKIDHP